MGQSNDNIRFLPELGEESKSRCYGVSDAEPVKMLPQNDMFDLRVGQPQDGDTHPVGFLLYNIGEDHRFILPLDGQVGSQDVQPCRWVIISRERFFAVIKLMVSDGQPIIPEFMQSGDHCRTPITPEKIVISQGIPGIQKQEVLGAKFPSYLFHNGFPSYNAPRKHASDGSDIKITVSIAGQEQGEFRYRGFLTRAAGERQQREGNKEGRIS